MFEMIRRFTQTWAAKILFGLLIMSFGVFWGMSDMISHISSKNYVAIVGGEKVTIKEFQRTLYQEVERIGQTLGKKLTPEEIKEFGLDKRVLRKLITQKLIELETQKMGIRVSDSKVREEIYKIKFFQDKNGLFDHDRFSRFVQNQGYRESEFTDLVRNDMAKAILFGAIIDGIRTAEILPNAVYDYVLRPREVHAVKLPFDQVKVPDLKDKDLQDFYALNAQEFKTPEYRKITYYVLPKDKLDKSRDLEDKLASGKSLKEVAKDMKFDLKSTDFFSKTGDDKNGKKQKGLTEDPSFLDVAFSTALNADSMLFELKSGEWCVLNVDTVEASHVPEFTKIKDKVLRAAKLERQKKEAEKIARLAVEELKDKKTTLEAFGKKFNQPAATYKNIVRSSEDPKKAPFHEGILAKILGIPYGSHGFVITEDYILVASVIKALPRDEAKKKKNFETFSDRVDDMVGNDLVNVYLMNLEKSYGVEKYL